MIRMFDIYLLYMYLKGVINIGLYIYYTNIKYIYNVNI